ncbi:MAG: hypothetical protein AAB573_05215 [Patescibacteria group bacterium]
MESEMTPQRELLRVGTTIIRANRIAGRHAGADDKQKQAQRICRNVAYSALGRIDDNHSRFHFHMKMDDAGHFNNF